MKSLTKSRKNRSNRPENRGQRSGTGGTPVPLASEINRLLTYKQFNHKHYAVSAEPSLPGPRYQALLQLLRTAEALWNASRNFFARWDLSPSQFNVLNLLYDQPD